MKPYEIIESHKAIYGDGLKQWYEKVYGLYASKHSARHLYGVKIFGTPARGSSEKNAVKGEENFLFELVDTLTALMVPGNPQITLNALNKEYREFQKQREALINDRFTKAELAPVLLRATALAVLFGYGAIKTVWTAPRDDLAGGPLYIPLQPWNFWFDRKAATWRDVSYAIEVTQISKKRFIERINNGTYDKDALLKYQSAKGDNEGLDISGESDQGEVSSLDRIVVYEWHDFESGNYGHYLDGMEQPLFFQNEPLYSAPRKPFTLITYKDNLVNAHGLGAAALLENQQDNLNEFASLHLRHTQLSLSRPIVDVEAMGSDGEGVAAQLAKAHEVGEAVVVKGLPQGKMLADLIQWTQSPPPVDLLTPQQKIRQNMNQTVGLSDMVRGAVGGAEVATEASIVEEYNKSRIAPHIKTVHRAIKDLSRHTMQLYDLYLEEGASVGVMSGADRSLLSLSREEMGMGEVEDLSRPWEWHYSVHPYNASERDKAQILATIQLWYPIIAEMQNLDRAKFARFLLELLGIEDMITDVPGGQGAAMPTMANGGQNPMNGEGLVGNPAAGAQDIVDTQESMAQGGPGSPVNAAMGGMGAGAAMMGGGTA